MKNFTEAQLPPALLDRLEQMGFTSPTPIQAQAIPQVLQGKDLLASAQTGTGKTGAYGIPVVSQLLNSSHGNALILLPTRELAVQVMQTLKTFIGRSKIATALLIGGEGMPNQFRQLRANPDLIVGTPGRVFDHINRGTLGILKKTNFLILDEADRMLDMGFGVQIKDIVHHIPKNRQTLMFSATLPQNIKNLSDKYLTDPMRIAVGTTHTPAESVKQSQVNLTDAEKYPRLVDELQERKGTKIVFVKTKRTADRMAIKLRKEGIKVDALHGDLRQNQRNRVIAKFRKQSFNVLVATDVAARGLDIPHIEHVINYDLPQQPEDYIHRIGRTGRAGAVGEAINFIGSTERKLWHAIECLLHPGKKREGFPARKGKKRNYKGEGRNSRPNNGRRRGSSSSKGRRGGSSSGGSSGGRGSVSRGKGRSGNR